MDGRFDDARRAEAGSVEEAEEECGRMLRVLDEAEGSSAAMAAGRAAGANSQMFRELQFGEGEGRGLGGATSMILALCCHDEARGVKRECEGEGEGEGVGVCVSSRPLLPTLPCV